jgi:hypothetical protein
MWLNQAAECDRILLDLEKSTSPEEFALVKEIAAKILAEIYLSGLYPIFENHEDLKPDGLL